MPAKTLTHAFCAFLCAFLMCAIGYSQDVPGPAKPAAPVPEAPKAAPEEKPPQVLFEQDRESAGRLQKAAELVQAGHFQQALDLYEWVMEHGAPGLTMIPDGRFLRARDVCNRAMTAMPKDLLAGYRARADGEVARRYEDAKRRVSPEELQSLAEQYYPSSSGPEMLDLAGDVYAGQGRAAEAVRCWERALDWGLADVTLTRETVEAKLAPALMRLGRTERAAAMREEIRRRRPEPMLAFGGQQRKLAEYLDANAATVAVPAEFPDASGAVAWRQWGGGASHDRAMRPATVPDGKIGVLKIPDSAQARPGGDWHPGLARQPAPVMPSTSFYPVIDRGRLFLHDDTGILAVSLDEAAEVWHVGRMSWTPRRERRSAQNQGDVWQRAGPDPIHVCCIADGRVYASLNGAEGGAQLVATDLDGKALWTIGKTRKDFEWLESSRFGDPVFAGGRLFFVALRTDSGRVEPTLVCVDAADGTLRWKTFLCSGGWIRQTYLVKRILPAFTLTLPAVEAGVAVVCTDVGGVMAVDAANGEVLWGYAYERIEIPKPEMSKAFDYATYPIASHNSTPIIHGDTVYVAPADSPRLYALDLQTGRLAWSFARGEYDRVLGLAGERLFLTGSAVCALNLADGKTLWTQAGERFAFPSPGAVTSDALLVPGPDAVIRIDPATGKVLGRFALNKDEQEFGALVATGDALAQVGTHVQVYGLRAPAQVRIEDRVRKDPADASAWAALGYAAARYGSPADAVRHYERALALLKAAPSTSPALTEDVKRRLYALYRPEIRRLEEAGNLTEMLSLALRAVECASTESEELDSRARIADAYIRRKEWPQALEQLQSFLMKPYRTAFAFEPDVEVNPAIYAQRRISDLIAENGRAIYAAYDAAAAALLAAGGRDNLEKLMSTYPNSTAASKALLALSETCAAQKDIGDAAGHLSDYLYWFGKNDPNRAALLWRLADYYDRLGLTSAMFETLDELSKAGPDAKVETPAGAVTVADAVAAKTAGARFRYYGMEMPAMSALKLPLQEQRRIDAGGTFDAAGHNLLVVSPDYMTYNCLDADGGKTLWSYKSKWAFVDRFVLGPKWTFRQTDQSLDVLSSATGERMWGFSIADPAIAERIGFDKPNFMAGLSGDRVSEVTPIGPALFASIIWGNESTEQALFETGTGRILWKRKVGDLRVGALLGNDRVFQLIKDRLVVIDRHTGRTIRELPVLDQPFFWPWTLLPGGRMLLSVGGRPGALCIDVETGKALWKNEMGNEGLSGMPVTTHLKGKLVYAGVTSRSALFCMDLDAGKQLWSRQLSNDPWYSDSIAADEQRIYVRGKGMAQTIEAFNLETGEPLWKTEPLTGVRISGWALLKNAVIISGYEFDMVAPEAGQGNNPIPKFRQAQLLCLDKNTGKVAQRIVLKDDKSVAENGTGFGLGGQIVPSGDAFWLVFGNRMVRFTGAP